MSEEIGPGNYDRAWNDPPQFAFTAGGGMGASAGNDARRRLMNKRVPVPCGSPYSITALPGENVPYMGPSQGPPIGPLSVGSPPIGPPQGVPPSQLVGHPVVGPPPVLNFHLFGPPPTAVAPPGMRVKTKVERKEAEEVRLLPQEILQEVDRGLTDTLASLTDKMQPGIQEDINKRLGIMRNYWMEGKLNSEVQSRMYHLVNALKTEDYDFAWSLHQRLIVDYTGMCSPWMVGVKTLIAEARSHSTLPVTSPPEEPRLEAPMDRNLAGFDFGGTVMTGEEALMHENMVCKTEDLTQHE
ncbi:steroid receptor RNA activator 1-like [Oratosquilla oratoria]|uniref:steroid receptor RNA activator 1-like n=1 Tax=Oratosquilla oratoria TaxID=337810 RepID=UPI003F77522E